MNSRASAPLVRFCFKGPKGFHGTHAYEVTALGHGRTRLRHVLEMDARGRAQEVAEERKTRAPEDVWPWLTFHGV